jgi:hypothetical protein
LPLGKSRGPGDSKFPKCLGEECWCRDCCFKHSDPKKQALSNYTYYWNVIIPVQAREFKIKAENNRCPIKCCIGMCALCLLSSAYQTCTNCSRVVCFKCFITYQNTNQCAKCCKGTSYIPSDNESFKCLSDDFYDLLEGREYLSHG